ncbi:MAG: RagB/SusD family nutrient uptake outer membrane protein [Prevotellaceae bacterium]|jgi:hypothetical protein|nr:RagB/SusD family nutrient uptake outer membrane protein [Prevotellaceae bacterium]
MKIKNIFLICSLVFSAMSCSLDYEPLESYSDVTEGVNDGEQEIVFKDRDAVLLHVQSFYDQLRNDAQEHWYTDILLVGDVHSDNAYAGTTGAEVVPYETNAIEGSNSVMDRDWSRHLANVARANRLICNIDDVDDATLTTAEREEYKAVAKIFRAMVYFDMVRLWGSVPVITTIAGDITSETVIDVYPEYFPPQNTELEVYTQIEKDLLEALEYAPNNNLGNKTVLSKSVARALLAKVYAEKPLRNYDKVIQYCDELVADGFDLVADFSDLFGVTLQDPSNPPSQSNPAISPKAVNTQESILEVHYSTGGGNWVTWMFGRQLDNWSFYFTWAKWITPSRDLIKSFQDAGDTKRFEESVVYYECEWSNYYPANHYPFMYKCRSSFSSIIRLRFADILLLKAEALILKDNPDFAGAASILNKIRNRAELGNLPSAATSNKEAILDAYLKERRLELAFEGQRWFDLVRLDKVEGVMNAVYAKDSGRKPQAYLFNQDSYRLPIPQAAIDQNPNLVQNPGY